jgi:hypothetical protein
MILTIVATLGGVALGAWIFWLARGGSGGGGMRGARPAGIDLGPHVAQIRALLRAANGGDVGAAAQAMGILDSLEATYGYETVAAFCSPEKLRRLASKVQTKLRRLASKVQTKLLPA